MWVCDCGFLKKVWVDPVRMPFCPKCDSELREVGGQLALDVFSSVPVSCDVSVDDVSRIRRFLLDRRGVFFKSTQLNEVLKLNDKGSCPKIRKAITLLIFQGVPIISTAKGYTMPKDPKMIRAYIESLQGRSRALDRRIAALEKILEMKRDGRELETLV